MGYRLHVCKTYKVEFGDGRFNNFYDCIQKIMSEFCNNICSTDSDLVIEISNDDFEDFLKQITYNKDKVIHIIKEFANYQSTELNCNISDIDKYCSDRYDYILQSFKEMFEQADKHNYFIRFEWF